MKQLTKEQHEAILNWIDSIELLNESAKFMTKLNFRMNFHFESQGFTPDKTSEDNLPNSEIRR